MSFILIISASPQFISDLISRDRAHDAVEEPPRWTTHESEDKARHDKHVPHPTFMRIRDYPLPDVHVESEVVNPASEKDDVVSKGLANAFQCHHVSLCARSEECAHEPHIRNPCREDGEDGHLFCHLPARSEAEEKPRWDHGVV
eukprot:CAMPEP_0185209768 /NCGR_PEP_ID=MMETSP1140-20130426/64366_1 /TAXON_ID=298111 /ORGANISM="Pavlova sp., Strain CCMP459" /LENGTH=143 /DNA_ID=CAMNT_0027777535 /DNA_START=177 /DNA_END=606 /DNA_ORIENTATION=+